MRVGLGNSRGRRRRLSPRSSAVPHNASLSRSHDRVLFPAKCAEKSKVRRRNRLWGSKAAPAGRGEWCGSTRRRVRAALGVRNRDHRDRRKCREDYLVFRQVESPMERGDERGRADGKTGRTDSNRDESATNRSHDDCWANPLEHGYMQRIRVADRAIQTQCLRPTRLQFGQCLQIAACEQNDVMSKPDQFVGQPRNNTLSASVELRRRWPQSKGAICAICMHSPFCEFDWALTPKCRSAQRPDPTVSCGYRRANLNLGSARPILPRRGSESRSVLNQQATAPPEGARGGPRLPSHSTRLRLPQSPAARPAMRGRG